VGATATHLWVSHFHDDHLQLPTLRRLAAVNPGVILIANRSYNFDVAQAAQAVRRDQRRNRRIWLHFLRAQMPPLQLRPRLMRGRTVLRRRRGHRATDHWSAHYEQLCRRSEKASHFTR
jgi:hypothetical protein